MIYYIEQRKNVIYDHIKNIFICISIPWKRLFLFISDYLDFIKKS